jgi:hypothetical protein
MLNISRRKMLGASMVGSATLLSGCGLKASAERMAGKGRILLNQMPEAPEGLYEAMNFPLIEAIHGRRSRRFALGASIANGPLAYTSKHAPTALSELEKMLLLTTVSGNTGWSNLIPYNKYYSPKIPNYAGAAGGRTFPSAAGFHTSDLFFTDDSGTYFVSTKDMLATDTSNADGDVDLNSYLDSHRSRIVTLSDHRLNTPASPQHMEMHNEWCANVPGSTLLIPVADLAQHLLLSLCYLVQNGACIYDDVHNRPIPGMEAFKDIVDVENPYPLSYVDQLCLTEVTVETSTALYAGALMLQAMGLGGWMYEGINPFSILGASGDPEVPGLGFSFDVDERWPLPNVTGLEGVFEGHCPPHFPNMHLATEAVIARKFGAKGPYNANTPGPYKDNNLVRGSAESHNNQFKDCVATMAQYIYDTFGRFPATVPSIFTMMYLQAHHLDIDFYDKHLSQGSYLRTHANHQQAWATSV